MPLRAIAAVLAICVALVAAPVASAQQAAAEGLIRLAGAGAGETLPVDRIESLPQHELPSSTSLDPPDLVFSGALLSDVLALIGAADAPAITVRAVDGYAAVVPREDWMRWPLVLATRVDGKRMGLRERGPARLIYPVHRFPELDDRTYVDRSVWMIDEIAW